MSSPHNALLPPDVSGRFGLPASRIWLNAAHQGALPRIAAEQARRAIEWKLDPARMTPERFAAVPLDLKKALGTLLGVPAEEIILTNGASYGVHLLANGLPLRSGDEVIVMDGDFPSNVLPWLGLREQGVVVRVLRPADEVLSAGEIEQALTPRTRGVCVSWVHSFSGRRLDISAIGSLCRERGAWLAVNATQILGARPLDVASEPVDAVVAAGWKWLCGPYGTGLAWLREPLRRTLRYNQAYWLASQTQASLGLERPEIVIPEPGEARRYDVFATANFFNFVPFRASVELLLEIGLEPVRCHIDTLVARLISGLDTARLRLVSREDPGERTSLVVVSHRDPARNPELYGRLSSAGIHVALRRGRIRVSPHLYNTADQIDRVVSVLRDEP